MKKVDRAQFLEKRRIWIGDVSRNMITRGAMMSKWKEITKGLLHSLSFESSAPLFERFMTNIGELYDIAAKAKVIFDQKIYSFVNYSSRDRKAELIMNNSTEENHPPIIVESLSWEDLINRKIVEEPCLIVPTLKSRDRVNTKGKEYYSKMKFACSFIDDIIRASIICISESHILFVLKEIKDYFQIISMENRFDNPLPNGYMDIILRVLIFPFPNDQRAIVCEIQIHHIDIVNLSIQLDTYSLYCKFRSFFGKSSHNFKFQQERLKVFKKLDQVGDDMSQLEPLMEAFLNGQGRVSRDIQRLGIFVDLFLKTGENALAQLIQSSIIHQLQDKSMKSELSCALGLLANHYTSIGEYSKSEPLCKEALSLCVEINGKYHKETAIRYKELGSLYYCQSLLKESIEFYEESLHILQSIQNQECCNEIIELYVILGELFEDLEEWMKALRYYSKAIEAQRSLQESDQHPLIGDMESRLGYLYEALLDHEQALIHYQKSMDICLYCFDAVHPTVLDAMKAMGHVYLAQGRFRKAYEIFDRELVGRRLTPNNQLALCLNRLGEICFDAQDYALSEQYYVEAYSIYLSLLEKKIIDRESIPIALGLASIQSNLAELYLRKGKNYFLTAKSLLNDSFVIQQRYLGLSSLSTQHTQHLMDMVIELIQQDDVDMEMAGKKDQDGLLPAVMEDLAEKALAEKAVADTMKPCDVYEELHDLKSIRQLDEQVEECHHWLIEAEECRDSGDFKKSEHLYSKIIWTLQTRQEKKKPHVQESGIQEEEEHEVEKTYDFVSHYVMNQEELAANNLMDPNNVQQDHVIFPISFNIGFDLASLIVFASFAIFLEDYGDFEESERILRIVVKNTKEMFQDQILVFLGQNLANLGSVLLKSNKIEESLVFLQESLALFEKLDVKREIQVQMATLHHHLGLCYHALNQYDASRQHLDRALELRKEYLGTDHPDYSSVLNSLGLLSLSQDNVEDAYEILKDLLISRVKSCGTHHPAYAVTLNNFAVVHFIMDDLAKAGKMFTESLELREKLLRKATYLVHMAARNLGAVFSYQNDEKNAAPFFHGADIIEEFLQTVGHHDLH